MSKIHLSKIEHRGAVRIKVLFEKHPDLISKIKTIKGRRWSKTKNCWHLPYTSESFKELKKVFGENLLAYEQAKPQSEAANEKTIEDRKSFEEVIEPQFVEYRKDGELRKFVTGEKIIANSSASEFFEVYIPFDKKGWVSVIRNIAGRRWDSEKICWLLPNVKTTFRHLKKYIGLENIIFNFRIEKDIPEKVELPSGSTRTRKQKASMFDKLSEEGKAAVFKLDEKLLLAGLSQATRKSYNYHLSSLFFYYGKESPEKITKSQVEQYLLHRIRFDKISESSQNQLINAVKSYWERVLNRPKEQFDLQRPKKHRSLPDVLSRKEVERLLNGIDNKKHRLAMLLIYSSGLRLGELTGLQVTDINIDRMMIHIQKGKGKKDRYVTLARTVLPFLQEYLKIFEPVRWLFEGQHGGQYSKRSVQSIFNKAVRRSKVNSGATVHTLRHSYATHCMEDGHHMKAVQEALGHASPKTTQIYLHLSNRSRKKFKSPLDKMNLKSVQDTKNNPQ